MKLWGGNFHRASFCRGSLKMASHKSLLILVAVLLAPSLVLGHQTDEFRARFMERCKEFGEEKGICDRILQTFEKAYVGKHKCSVSARDYSDVFSETPFTGPCGKTVFNSGTYIMAHEFTKDRDLFTVQETLLGYVMNGPDEWGWCGKVNSKETFTEDWDDCLSGLDPRTSFWQAASTKFAEFACDEIIVMLNGTTNTPYFPKTFFQLYEVPNFQPPKAKQLTVVLLTEKSREPCSCDSLGALRTDLHKDIGCTCHSVPQERLQECINEKTSTAECW